MRPGFRGDGLGFQAVAAAFALSLTVGVSALMADDSWKCTIPPPMKASATQSAWSYSAGDHKILKGWTDNLRSAADQIDACTDRGAYSRNATPDDCQNSYDFGLLYINGENEEFSSQLARLCKKNVGIQLSKTKMPDAEKYDCETAGEQFWRLDVSLNRAVPIPKWGTKYVSSVDPMEVDEQTKALDEINSAFKKGSVNPALVFMMGGVDEGMNHWIIHHCPTIIAWGKPPEPYASALPNCRKFERALERFELNVIRVIESYSPENEKAARAR